MNDKKKFINYFGMLFCTIWLFFVGALVVRTGCDYASHMQVAEKLTFEKMVNPLKFILEFDYPLWHFLTKMCMYLFRMPLGYAAAIINGLFVSFSFICVYFLYVVKEFGERKLSILITFVICIVGPLYVPWYSNGYLIGQDSPNVWHSPTAIAVKPIAILTFWYIIRILKGNADNLTYWIIAIGLLFSNLAKPNFVQILFPTLLVYGIYLLVISKGKMINTLVKLALSCLPSCLYTIVQIFVSFYYQEDGGGIEIAFLKYWRYSAKNIVFSIILVLAFPLMVLVVSMIKKKMSQELVVSWIMMSWGIIEKALLEESGTRAYAGNFSWGYQLALFFVWLFSIINFFKIYFKDGESGICNKKDVVIFDIMSSVLILDFLWGAWYIYTLIIEGRII